MKKVIIIGSGFSSLTAACYLAKSGFEVLVLEKNEQLGGRASMWEIDGFRFDLGPSWYWMPDIFEKFFADFGKKPSDYYSLQKLNPAYRVFFGNNDYIDIEDSVEKISNAFESVEKGSGKQLKNFLKNAEKNYQIAMKDLVYQPGISITELITLETIKRLPLFFKNISQQVRKNIKNKKLQSILEFPVLFLGAKPNKTPAFYNFMNWADFGLGTWYPKGGFNSVAKAFVKVAEELGVQFKTNETVQKLDSENGKITKIITQNAQYSADIVISGADYAHTETLISLENANYSKEYWKSRTFAPSALLYYVAFDKKVNHLLHHNLFFDADFSNHSEEIYDSKIFPKNPLFYANFSSKTDDSLCENGKEIGFFLIPIAVDLEDSKEIHEHYFELLMSRIEHCTGENLRENVLFKKSFGVEDFKNRYNSCRGNAYGLANTLLQTSILRPSIRNKKLKNLYYTGQLTVPGPGVPPAIISGKIVSDFVLKNHKK